MTIDISANNPRISYSVAAGVTQTSFAVPFEFFDDSDLNVYIDTTLQTITTNYTVTGGAGSTGTVTMTVTGPKTVIFTRDTTIERTTDFTAGVDINRAALNTQLDTLTAIAADNQDLGERSIRITDYDPAAANLLLPDAATRADKLLSFDTEGDIQVQAAGDLLTGSILGANYIKASHIGDGTTVAFGTTEAAGSKNNIQVYIDGVYQNKDTFSISGSTLTFSETPPLNSAIEFIVGNAVTSLTTDPDVVTYNQGGTGAQDRTLTSKLQEDISLSDFGGDGALAASAGYATKARMFVKTGEVAKLVCDPTSGDDIQAMSEWISSKGHYVEQGGSLYLEIADGLHNVNTYIDIVDQGLLDIRGTAVPDFLDVVSATFSGTSGAITATINVNASSPLPSRVQAGFAVGGLNIQGDGGADVLNCGLLVKARNSDTQFTADIYSDGTNLAAFTTPDNTASLGLTPNKLMVPHCTIRAAETGWDGGAREGFMNAERGGRIHMKYVGLSYNGTAGDNDMMFATDAGSEISLEDYSVIAGTGEMCVRSFNHANIYTNRSCLGGAHTGANVWQGSGGGTLTAIRTMMGSVTADALSNSSGAEMFITSCVVTGANILVRTTYPDASASVTSSRLSRGEIAVAPTEGNISIDSNSSIKNNTTPISVSGSNSGIAHGNPTISGNTNATVTAFEIQTTGGVWLPSATKPYDPTFYKVGRFSAALDFPSISAHSYADLTVACSGAAFNDFCMVQRSGSTEPAQGIDFRAFVSAADTVTVRAFNVTTGAINPNAFTALVLVIRAT